MRQSLIALVCLYVSCSMSMNAQTYSWWQENTNTFSKFRNVNFADNNTGWAFGDSSDANGFVSGVIFRTTNQGLTWSMQLTPSPSIRIYSSYFSSVTNGIAVGRFQPGGGVSMITNDGGFTWQVDSLSFPERLYDISATDPINCWICGRNGYGANSSDGGVTWTVENTNTAEHLYSVAFCDATNGWMVGADPGTGGTIIKTTDGGLNWIVQNNTTPNDLMGVYAFSAAKAVAVGFAGTIVMTTDSGNTWQQMTSGTPEDLLDVTFTDTLHGWATGTAGTILVTSDGGLTWSPFVSNTTNAINSISMRDTTLGWFCGDNGDIFFYGYSPVGIEEASLTTASQLFPNPTSGSVIVRNMEANSSIEIYNMAGSIVNQYYITTAGDQIIDISTFSPGTYLMQIRRPDGAMIVHRLVRN